MRLDIEPARLRLAPGQTLRLRDAAGHTVRCDEGSVWITEDRLPRDICLAPGERYRLERPGLALVQAFGDASVDLS